MVLETSMKLRVTEMDFPKKHFAPKTENEPKIWFFEFVEKFRHFY